MTAELSDRDLAIECCNELDEMMKQLIMKASTGPSGEIQYLTHRPAQTIRLARSFSVIAGCEQTALESMLAVRNLFAHHNGLSFSDAKVSGNMGPVRNLIKPNKVECDRQAFGLAYRELVTRFLLRLGDGQA